jgi:hypothetical protein
MTTFERGAIVEFGPPSARRVGVVVGAYDDWQRGETLCVLTPEARAKGQAFDTCPIDLMNVKPSTIAALQAHVEDVRRAFDARIEGFIESLALA